MSTLSLSLSAEDEAWIQKQVKTGEYLDAGDCLRDLIRRNWRAARLQQAGSEG